MSSEEVILSKNQAIKNEFSFLKQCIAKLRETEPGFICNSIKTAAAISFNRFRNDLSNYDARALPELYAWVDYTLGPIMFSEEPPITIDQLEIGLQAIQQVLT